MKISRASDTKINLDDLPSEQDLKRQIMLTSAIVWKRELIEKDIESWLCNFKGEVFTHTYERRLALWLLANFVYYNENEVGHLCRTLYHDYIHRMLEERGDILRNIEDSIKEILNCSKFYYLGKPSESGAFLLYYFRQETHLPSDNFIFNPEDLSEAISNIVFIDDVTLSEGKRGQAVGYLEEAMKGHLNNKRSILLTFIATKKAIEYLERHGTTVISCIILDERNKCFSDESSVFHYFKNHLDRCKSFAEHYGKKVKPSIPLGYNDGQFVFGFFYNTPDNSLPIFWADNNDWCPIIKRYDKNYDKSKYIESGKFV